MYVGCMLASFRAAQQATSDF